MAKTIRVWTAPIHQWRAVKKLDLRFYDITYMTGVKAGNGAFAPEARLVQAYKAGEVSIGLYVDHYTERMKRSMENNPEAWDALLAEEKEMVFACYCKPGVFCHRHPFVDLLEEYASKKLVRTRRMGEFTEEVYTKLRSHKRHQIGTDLVELMTPVMMLKQYLLASCAYYIHHESPYVDDAYDVLCRRLLEEWDKFDHPLKRLTTPDALSAGTGYHIREEEYPRGMWNLILDWCDSVYSGDYIMDMKQRLPIRKRLYEQEAPYRSC